MSGQRPVSGQRPAKDHARRYIEPLGHAANAFEHWIVEMMVTGKEPVNAERLLPSTGIVSHNMESNCRRRQAELKRNRAGSDPALFNCSSDV